MFTVVYPLKCTFLWAIGSWKQNLKLETIETLAEIKKDSLLFVFTCHAKAEWIVQGNVLHNFMGLEGLRVSKQISIYVQTYIFVF